MHPNANNIQTHQFNWNAWLYWMFKMKCYENLNGEELGIWETHWNGRLQPFYNGSITCGYEDCQAIYTDYLTEWNVNLNNEVIPQMQTLNFVSSCTVQNNFYVKGSRRYELSNHLGNVLAVVSDRKIESDEDYFYAGLGSGYKFENGTYIADIDGEYKQNSGQDGIISSYSAEVISASDYYAFGSLMPGRSFSGGEYKFGFNGKELDRDDEGMGGGGSTYDYGFRIYNAQLGRFLSVDPLTESYPWYTPYQFAGNSTILNVDVDGLEEMNYLLKMLNIYLGTAPKPVNAEEAQEQAQHYNATKQVIKHIEKQNEAYETVYGAILPGYGALCQIGRGNYGTAGLLITFDLVGGNLVSKGFSSAVHILSPLFKSPILPSRLLELASVKSFNFYLGREKILKTAVIGQGMKRVQIIGEGLKDAVIFKPSEGALRGWDELLAKYKGKTIPDEEVISSEIYKENVDWINDCIKNGYNILDIGAIEGSLESTFYKMETESVKKAISNGTK